MMSNTIYKIIFVLFVLTLSNTLYGQKRAYDKAIKTNTTEGYISFLQKHLNSDYSEEIKEKLTTLEFEEIIKLSDFFSQQRLISPTSTQISLTSREIEIYEEFIEKYPNSQYQEQVVQKLGELENIKMKQEEVKKQEEAEELAALEELKKLKEAEKLARKQVEIYKMTLMEGYTIGITTEETFRSDGWNFDDPYDGRIGITGFKRIENRTSYYLGTSPINELGKRLMTESSFFENNSLYEGNKNVEIKPNNIAINAYYFVFENGILTSKEVLIKK